MHKFFLTFIWIIMTSLAILCALALSIPIPQRTPSIIEEEYTMNNNNDDDAKLEKLTTIESNGEYYWRDRLEDSWVDDNDNSSELEEK